MIHQQDQTHECVFGLVRRRNWHEKAGEQDARCVEQVLPQEESTPGKPIFAQRGVTCEAKRRGALGLDLDDFGAAGFVAAAPTAPRPTRNRSGRISGGAHGRAPGERA